MKNKRIATVTCSKSASIEPELYCKITPMYKQCQIQQNRNDDLFKVSQHTVNAKETKRVTHVLLYETNQYQVSKQGRKQITRKQITRTMTSSKSAVNALTLSKKYNTNGTCAADVEKSLSG